MSASSPPARCTSPHGAPSSPLQNFPRNPPPFTFERQSSTTQESPPISGYPSALELPATAPCPARLSPFRSRSPSQQAPPPTLKLTPPSRVPIAGSSTTLPSTKLW